MLAHYFKHLSSLDYLIWIVGITVATFALYGWNRLSKEGSQRSKQKEEVKQTWTTIQRILTVITDMFPLAGLLGTALAILNTFLNLKGPVDSSSVIADFAPGLTTTISGIACALLNTILIQLFLAPAMAKRFDS